MAKLRLVQTERKNAKQRAELPGQPPSGQAFQIADPQLQYCAHKRNCMHAGQRPQAHRRMRRRCPSCSTAYRRTAAQICLVEREDTRALSSRARCTPLTQGLCKQAPSMQALPLKASTWLHLSRCPPGLQRSFSAQSACRCGRRAPPRSRQCLVSERLGPSLRSKLSGQHPAEVSDVPSMFDVGCFEAWTDSISSACKKRRRNIAIVFTLNLTVPKLPAAE